MPKQAAPGPRTATPASAKGAPGKKRSRAVGPGTATTSTNAPAVEVRREPSHAEIAERAYLLYAARAFRDGDPVWDWLNAERELRSA